MWYFAWILGLPLNKAPAAPLTVWEGSHEMIRAALLHHQSGTSQFFRRKIKTKGVS